MVLAGNIGFDAEVVRTQEGQRLSHEYRRLREAGA